MFHRAPARRMRPPVGRSVWRLAIVLGLFVAFAFSQSPIAQTPPGGLPQPARVTPILAADGVPAGSQIRAALQVRLDEGLHANSNRPRDPGLIEMELRFEVPDGVTIDEIVWPEPKDLEQLGASQPLSVFERDFTIGVVLNVAAAVPPGMQLVRANLKYQACDDRVCYFPETIRSAWAVRVVPAGTAVTPAHQDVFRTLAFGRGEKPAEGTVGALTAAPTPDAASSNTPDAVLAALKGFEVVGTAGGYLDTEDFLQFIRDAEAGVANRSWFEGRGPIAILALVLVGGLALNLTPCVLPMIPINLAIIGAGVRAGSRARGFLLGGAYGAAMAVVYGLLGLIVVLTAGTFGTINSSAWFNAAIAALFVVLGLAMFDVVTIDFSRLSSRLRFNESSRGTFLLAFSMGAVAALLAGACVAPVVIQVVLFASDLYAGGTTVALALPFLLGVGMAIPWPIAGAGIAALPKPGAWMVRVKYVFGVFILATAAYYAYTAYGIVSNRWVDAAEVAESVAAKLDEGWHASLAAGLAEAAREGKPVLIDFWATWCKNCLVMDRTTLADPAVTGALANYVKIKFQAEDPNASPAREVLAYVNGVGLPTYAVLKPVR